MEGSPVKVDGGRYIDTTDVLFICGGAFVGLNEIMAQSRAYKYISVTKGDNQQMMDRLNSRVKPTDLFSYGLIPEFTGRLPIVGGALPHPRSLRAPVHAQPVGPARPRTPPAPTGRL